jgi:hypothetical protein
MLESPLLQKMLAEQLHKAIKIILKARFGATPRNVTGPLREILNERKLIKLNGVAAKCRDLEAFRQALLK